MMILQRERPSSQRPLADETGFIPDQYLAGAYGYRPLKRLGNGRIVADQQELARLIEHLQVDHNQVADRALDTHVRRLPAGLQGRYPHDTHLANTHTVRLLRQHAEDHARWGQA